MNKNEYEKIIEKINILCEQQEKVIIAIDGNCGSGKTAFAKQLKENFDCNLFHIDDFFLRKEQRTEQRLKEIGGNFDYERFEYEILKNIVNKKVKTFAYKKFSCKNMDFSENTFITNKNINIIEGSYSLHNNLIRYYDLKIFLELDITNQIKNISKRDNGANIKDFIEKWIPKEDLYFKTFNIKKKCDFVFKGYIQ